MKEEKSIEATLKTFTNYGLEYAEQAYLLLIWTTKSHKIKYFCLDNDKSRAWWLYFVYTQNTLEKATHQFAEGVFR